MLNGELLHRLESLGYKRSYQQTAKNYREHLGAFIGVANSYIVNLAADPDGKVREIFVRVFDHFDSLPPIKQQEAIDLWLAEPLFKNRKRPKKNIEHIRHGEKLRKRLMKLGMSKLGFYSLLGIKNSVYDIALERERLQETQAQVVYLIGLYDDEQIFDVMLKYEVSQRAIPKLEESKSRFLQKQKRKREKENLSEGANSEE